MKKTLFVAALLATASVGATSAYATDICGTDRCSYNYADLLQNLDGLQIAINMIVDIDDANTIVQEAVNAGNLVNIEADIDLANVEQNASVYQFAGNLIDGDALGHYNGSDLTRVTQSATNVANSVSSDRTVKAVKQTSGDAQMAGNAALGTYDSKFYDLQQAATNVVNTVTAGTSKTVNQLSTTDQVAINVIHGGWGGYDADAVNWGDDTAVETQAAVNAANLVNLDSLTGAIKQTSYGSQDAINKAIFSGNVYDLGQSATNVANSVSVGSITPAVFDCLCYDGWEVNQLANVDQFAKNLLVTVGDVNNTIQSATNIANSINVATPTAP